MGMNVKWRTFEQVTPEDVANANGYNLLLEDFEYSVEELITNRPKQMSMPETYYFFSIQLDDIDKNKKLEQNIDWGGTFDPTLD